MFPLLTSQPVTANGLIVTTARLQVLASHSVFGIIWPLSLSLSALTIDCTVTQRCCSQLPFQTSVTLPPLLSLASSSFSSPILLASNWLPTSLISLQSFFHPLSSLDMGEGVRQEHRCSDRHRNRMESCLLPKHIKKCEELETQSFWAMTSLCDALLNSFRLYQVADRPDLTDCLFSAFYNLFKIHSFLFFIWIPELDYPTPSCNLWPLWDTVHW